MIPIILIWLFFLSESPNKKKYLGVSLLVCLSLYLGYQLLTNTISDYSNKPSIEINKRTYTTPLQPYFKGKACTQDCSGHKAGYAWAEEHDLQDISDCDGNSASFIEGCESYVEELNNESGSYILND